MTKRLTATLLVLALTTAGCGLGDKEAQADQLIKAGRSLMGASSVAAEIAVKVKVLPSERKLVVQDTPRIAPGSLSGLASTLRPRANDASVAGVVRFVDDVIYERIAPSTVKTAGLSAAIAPNNLQAIVEAVHSRATLVTTATPQTTSTTAPRTLRRTVQIVREWAAFDFGRIEDRDSTKHAGSFTINPVAVLRLATGVLTGSVERRSAFRFEANVSRDKAERNLSEDEREVLDKTFAANAITRTVFPARFALDESGRLVAFAVTMRQHLSSKDRADLTVTLRLGPDAPVENIARPPRRGTVTVNTLNELATAVSGA